MNSARKPIVITFAALQEFTQYTYAVLLYSFNQESEIEVYRGRCIADEGGSVNIAVDAIVRDFAYAYPRRWQQSLQSYVPAELDDFEYQHFPVDYIMSYVGVVVYDSNGNEIRRKKETFWTGWLPSWQKGELVYDDDRVANLALLGNSLVPHLPPIATPAMWLEIVLQWFDTHNTKPQLGTAGTRIPILTSGAGCYDLTFTLQSFFDEFSNAGVDGGNSNSMPDGTVDGGDSESVADDTIDGGDSTDNYAVAANVDINIYYGDEVLPVAHIDECASPYYVAWIMPNGGWMCWGFDGNVTQSASPEVSAIRDMLNSERVTGIDAQNTYNLYTGFVTREQHNLLSTLAYAREVYVYDTATDKGAWCTVENRNLPTAGNMRWRNEPFNVTLKEILHNEL